MDDHSAKLPDWRFDLGSGRASSTMNRMKNMRHRGNLELVDVRLRLRRCSSESVAPRAAAPDLAASDNALQLLS